VASACVTSNHKSQQVLAAAPSVQKCSKILHMHTIIPQSEVPQNTYSIHYGCPCLSRLGVMLTMKFI